ncbi:tRNA 2-selenouridine(34) synthase MnmH [Brevundimonas sp. NPDC090276]|uniref:tRNA 2-selenouridine(34) synthase MnmH n=1 Tax=Brevundimonas sp. NPDC090276 TaxID=3363956 RepID=UPI00383AC2AB
MARLSADVGLEALTRYDALIDVRSPGEFAEDHLPGAINLPVLNDAERAEVGTIYVRQSKFLARRLGAGLVARNIAAHLEGALAARDSGFQPMVYCWRGGQRSTAMTTVMDQVGWPVTRLDGGYQTWRRQVVARLYEPRTAPGLRLVLLDGLTGSGKTAVLSRLAARGVQSLDLEGLAEHRGSLFGGLGVVQPAQKLFDTRLFTALGRLDPERPIVVEAESSRIGRVTLPPVLWAAMKAAPRLRLSAPIEARVGRVLEDYAALEHDAEVRDNALRRLPRHHSREAVAAWRQLSRAGDLRALATALMQDHYDPAYRRASRDVGGGDLGEIALSGCAAADLDQAADAVAGAVARLSSDKG